MSDAQVTAAPTAGEEDGPSGVSIEVMVACEIPTPQPYVFRTPGASTLSRYLVLLDRGDRPPVVSPLVAYIVRHPSAGAVLIDTGYTLMPTATCEAITAAYSVESFASYGPPTKAMASSSKRTASSPKMLASCS